MHGVRLLTPRTARAVAAAAVALAAAACGRARAARAVSVVDSAAPGAASAAHAPGVVVDSALPPDEALQRFRADLPGPPASLTGAAASRDALVDAFARAVERADTGALRRLWVTRAEWAYFYYPVGPNAQPPYRLPPDLAWLRLAASSEKGIGRTLRRLGARPLGYVGYRCPDLPRTLGALRVWGPCPVRVRTATGRVEELSLFGEIVEKDRRFKFLSYASAL